MFETLDIKKESRKTYQRLLPRLQLLFQTRDADEWEAFKHRLDLHWKTLFSLLMKLYGTRYDFYYHLEEILSAAAMSWLRRPEDMRALDRTREVDSEWYTSEKMVGGALYVDLFSENLSKLKEQIPYFKKIGLTYVHLMPLFAVRAGDSDGGYAVNNYRSVAPTLGTMEDLIELAALLRKEGILLALDFVLNHTSDEHEWAKKAAAGDLEYQDYYFMYEDRTIPDTYEKTLREIFPTIRRGSFTWYESLQRWVWTTFNSFQWDLNYSNPAVFKSMAEEMLFLANAGVDILRLDAVAFIWKRMGTSCENLPEAHILVQAFNTLARIAAPGLIFKSEAIVAPDDVIKYIGVNECQLSYHPLLMALLWEALATREVRLLEFSLKKRHAIASGCSWVNYLRCHDDIGWTFDDGDAAQLGINAYNHRKFLNEFYTGQFPGSFAHGIPFQYNPDTGDMRISGTLASLAGLEQAIQYNDTLLMEMAVKRIILLRNVIMTVGGIPLLYLGEEWGMLNDYSYIADPAKEGDSRWIHRPRMRWESLEEWNAPENVGNRIFQALVHMIELRKKLSALRGNQTEIVSMNHPHVLGYVRRHNGKRLLVISNFSDHSQDVDTNRLRIYGVGTNFYDHYTGRYISVMKPFQLEPYQFVWLENAETVSVGN